MTGEPLDWTPVVEPPGITPEFKPMLVLLREHVDEVVASWREQSSATFALRWGPISTQSSRALPERHQGVMVNEFT